MIRPRDFIETKEGLLFAAISPKIAFLRYFPSEEGERKRGYQKVASTSSSFEYLEKNYPQYIARKSGYRLQHCQIEWVLRVYRPVEKLRELRSSKDKLVEKCLALSKILEDIPEENKGVTGSLLVDLHTPSSDIDFVVYGNWYFETARRAIERSKAVKPLGEKE
ncbi:MAG: nucleotidyltransferase domain-containing protein, partial [Candidatus Hydrothermarchaeales archaeon]